MPAVATPLAGSRLALFNPAAKLASAFVVMVGLLVTADLVTASTVLFSELLALPLARISLRALAARAWPLPLAAGGVAAANFVASDASPATIGAISLRLLAIAVPGVVVFASTDPVDLVDSLVQQLHVPARFAYGALAALRLLPILSGEWVTIHRARRARGIDPGRSPVRAAQLFASAVYALLVAAIRRGTRLALAMDSRGFGSGVRRSAARKQKVRKADWVLVAVALSVAAGANALALVVGTWHPLLG